MSTQTLEGSFTLTEEPMVPQPQSCVLTINGGASSIRFAIYKMGETLQRKLEGKMDRIGLSGSTLIVNNMEGQMDVPRRRDFTNHRSAVDALLDWLEAQPVFESIVAVGHRVVHGMKYSEPERITPELLTELRRSSPYDSNHLPPEIELIGVFRKRHPKLEQIACFDTAFHRTMPPVAKIVSIPRCYASKGVERYGFHGLSYAYLMEALAHLDDRAAMNGRVILAHLGSDASMAAVRNGKSIDTSMGLTPASGLVMSTRSGDLDPGLFSFLADSEDMSAAQFNWMINHESGLLGVSETSPDMRDLCRVESSDSRTAEAIELFCYQAKKCIGSYAAALGGLDTLVFTGGIGENASVIRARICEGLGFLGIELNESRNTDDAPLISRDGGRVAVRVICTDEEIMIARSVCSILQIKKNI